MASGQRRWVLTGGIGSGKSEVRRILEARGIRAIDADSVGHDVLAGEGAAPVSARWPDVVTDGVVDRRKLAEVVFADIGQLRELEGITHPLIFGRIRADLQDYAGVAVVEMPVLRPVEGWNLIVVDATDEVRLERTTTRGMPRDQVQRRMAMQPSRAEWLSVADIVVPNHGDRHELEAVLARLTDVLLGETG